MQSSGEVTVAGFSQLSQSPRSEPTVPLPDEEKEEEAVVAQAEAHAASAWGNLTAGTHCLPHQNNYVCWVQKVV